MKFSVKEKAVIITGGGSGIGKAMVRTFATEGAHVFILDSNIASGKSLESDMNRSGISCHFLPCDVTDSDQVANCIARIIKKRDKIDVLINNAGIGYVGNIEQTAEKDLDRLYEVNIKGVYNCTKEIIPHFKSQRGGVILNMVSVAASVGLSDRFAYAMTKGAALTMTYSIAKDYLDYNIRCNSISPARIHTPFVDSYINQNFPGQEQEMFESLSKTQPIGRMGTPQEVADLALYLCSDEAAFITGTDFPIDGGFIKLNS